jgi:hypothetical protein
MKYNSPFLYDGCLAVSLDLKQFIFPSQEIRDAVNDLLLYHQLQNQKAVQEYVKWKDKNYYKGDFFVYIAMSEIKELLELTHGKAWDCLIKAIYLFKHYSTTVDLENFQTLSPESQAEIIQIITKGMKAFDKITLWLAPIATKDILEAIYDSAKVTIGIGKYVQFQILKLFELKSQAQADKSIGLFDEILEIENPEDLVWFFKTRKRKPTDCLILTFTRNKTYDFKPSINMFLIWNNSMYVIESSERRLNLDNTRGARNPDRYLEDRFKHVWLPFDIVLGEQKEPKTTDIMVRGKRIFRRGSLLEVFKKSPEIKMWLNLFLYRVADYIKSEPVPDGVTPTMQLKMLEDLSIKIPTKRIESQSQHDASSYLVDKYGGTITSIAPIEKGKLLGVIGTKKYVSDVIRFEQRKEVAKAIKEQLYNDYRENAQRVFEWFKNFVTSHDLPTVVRCALANKKYSFMAYPDFSGRWTRFSHLQVKKPTLVKLPILQEEKYGRQFYLSENEALITVIWTQTGTLFTSEDYTIKNRVLCEHCKKFKWTTLVTLLFQDYRQVCEFFKVKPEALPHEIVEHLHQQNDVYVGNSILDDIDPVDLIKDPWFRRHKQWQEYNFDTKKEEQYEDWEGTPYLQVLIPLCERCKKKLMPRNARKMEKPKTTEFTVSQHPPKVKNGKIL